MKIAASRANLHVLLPGIAGLFAFSLIVNLLVLVQPIYMLQVYDRVLLSHSLDTLLYISLIAAGALLLLGLIDGVRGFMASRLSMRLSTIVGTDTLHAAMMSPRASLGDTQPLRDLSILRGFLGGRGLFAYLDLPFAPLFIGLLYFIHPLLFAVTCAGAALLVIIAFLNQKLTAGPSREASQKASAALLSAQSFIRDADTIGALGMVPDVTRQWGLQEGGALASQDRVALLGSAFAGVSRVVRLGLQISILGLGGYLVLQGEMTAGMIFASSLISGRGLQPIDQIIGSWRSLVEARSAWKRLDEALRQSPSRHAPTELPAPLGRLQIEELVVFPPFQTSPDPILKRVNAEIEVGQSLVILGPSGAGKSTLAQAIVGIIAPRAGAVRIDGSDIRHWDRDTLGRHIGYLPQDCTLLPGTVAQNISRFALGSGGEDIVRAASRAQVHGMIQALPLGYDTPIGPGGYKLSGGQRQRIALARAFFGDPRLLVLDEPNANLDREGDDALERAMREAADSGVTVVIVSQRPGIAQKVDRILVLREGAVQTLGSPEEVLPRRQPLPTRPAAPRDAPPMKPALVSSVNAKRALDARRIAGGSDAKLGEAS